MGNVDVCFFVEEQLYLSKVFMSVNFFPCLHEKPIN